ncbi:MAG TPA: PEP-CTERM sorting domain-containing protein [Verrucomicrobiae bacterium]|jgi:hypothetical protein|nr:PEP-CTERM sorting domain-containing protein [Verrucomicrobiae bacterium]
MNKLAKIAVVVAGLALVSQVANAANNDLILGFNGNGSANDYAINLGNATSLFNAGSGAVVDLSSDFSLSTFNSTFSSVNGTQMGAGGGTSSLNPVFFFTQNRGSAGDASTALSLTPPSITTTTASGAAGDFNGLSPFPAAGTGELISSANAGSFSSQMTTLGNNTGLNPSSAIGSGVIYEDLWQASKTTGTSTAWKYEGFLTFDTTGSTPSLTFTAAAVPEPSTYGLFGGAGILVMALRRQFRRKTA